jgi:hypothetical protein
MVTVTGGLPRFVMLAVFVPQATISTLAAKRLNVAPILSKNRRENMVFHCVNNRSNIDKNSL